MLQFFRHGVIPLLLPSWCMPKQHKQLWMMSDLPSNININIWNLKLECQMTNDLFTRLMYQKCEKFAAVVSFFLSWVVFVGMWHKCVARRAEADGINEKTNPESLGEQSCSIQFHEKSTQYIVHLFYDNVVIMLYMATLPPTSASASAQLASYLDYVSAICHLREQ